MTRKMRFNTVVVDPAGDPNSINWARIIEVSTAVRFPHMGGWIPIITAELNAVAGFQTFVFDDVEGRYLRLMITAAQSSDAERVSLASIALFLR